jgi:hypothetical protein
MDVPGQQKREYAREKICPIRGPDSLNASERLRKRKEIIALAVPIVPWPGIFRSVQRRQDGGERETWPKIDQQLHSGR